METVRKITNRFGSTLPAHTQQTKHASAGTTQNASSSIYSSNSSRGTGTTNVNVPEAAAHTERLNHKKAMLALISLILLSYVTALNTTNTVAALPVMVIKSASSVQGFWIVIAYLLTHAVFQPLLNALATALGRGRILFLSILFFMLGSVVSATSPTVSGIIAGQALSGTGAAGCSAIGTVLAASSFPPSVQGRYVAALEVSRAVGFLFGPLIGGAFAQTHSWRWMFFFNLPFCLVAIVAIFFAFGLRGAGLNCKQTCRTVDLSGSAFMIFGSVFLMMGISWGGVSFKWTQAGTIFLLVLGTLSLGVAVVWEIFVASEPFMRHRLFYRRASSIAYFTTFVQGFVMFSQLYFFSVYVQSVKSKGVLEAGSDVLALLLPIVPAFFLASYLCQKRSLPTVFIWIGLVIEILSCGLMILFDIKTPAGAWAIILIIGGFGHGFMIKGLDFTLQSHANNADLVNATNMSAFLRSLGMCAGVSTGSSVYLNLMKRNMASNDQAGALVLHALELVHDLKMIPNDWPAKTHILKSYVYGFKAVAVLCTSLLGLALLLSFAIRMHPKGAQRASQQAQQRPVPLTTTTRNTGTSSATSASGPRTDIIQSPNSPPVASPDTEDDEPQPQHHQQHRDTIARRRYIRNTSWFLSPLSRVPEQETVPPPPHQPQQPHPLRPVSTSQYSPSDDGWEAGHKRRSTFRSTLPPNAAQEYEGDVHRVSAAPPIPPKAAVRQKGKDMFF